MPKPEKITEDGLKALIDQEAQQAYGYGDGKLEEMRRRNEYYFLGIAKEDLAPPEIEGRSSVVDTTVRNTVLGMEGPLIKTFYGSDNVFEFEETKPQDAPKAKLISAYVNHIFRNKNPGYVITATWIREALQNKVGFLKVWWDDSDIETREDYRGMTDVQLALLMDDEEVEVIDQKAYEDEEAAEQKAKMLEQAQGQLQQMQQAAMQPAPPSQPGQPPQQNPAVAQFQQAAQQFQQMQAQPVPMLYDVSVKRTKSGGKLCIENVPPEEFLISKNAKSIETSPFTAHRVKRTMSYLRSAGYSIPEVGLSGDNIGADLSMERVEREQYNNEDSYLNDVAQSSDESMREYWVLESYMQCDFDGDGIAEWRKVVKCGEHILENEECDGPPFVALGSILLPHQFFGLCPADLAIEAQRIKTSLKRANLDNVYLQVNGGTTAVEGQVNLDDLLNNRPGRVVRIKSQGAVAPLQQGMGDIAGSMSLMEFFENETEEATGWTRQSQGGNGMQLQQTATQANIVTNRADSRVETISRYMAETGFKSLGLMILKLVTKYQNKPEMMRVAGGEWVDVDPREWTNQFDLSINVGLGTGNKDQLVSHLALLSQKQMEGLPMGVAKPENIYNLGKKLAEALGFKDAEQFFSDPAKQPPAGPPPPDPSIQVAQIKAQADQQKAQLQLQDAAQDRQHRAEMEQFKVQVEAQARMQIDINKQQAEADQKAQEAQNEAQLDAMRQQFEHERELAKLADAAAQRELDRYKIDQDNMTKIAVAEIAAHKEINKSLISAESAAQTAASTQLGASDGD